MYNIANESALFPTSGNERTEVQHVLADEDDLSDDDDDRSGVRKEHEQPQRIDGLSKALHEDPELQRLDREADLLIEDLDRTIEHRGKG